MAAITNGMNMIDGVNGLCAVVALAILGTFIFLSYKTGDAIMLLTNFYIILILVPFLVFNYPNGKIFLGDAGAYSLGLIASMLSIIFFGRHPEISPWSAVLILIYPAIEVIFTLCRRLLYSQKHFQPDRLHIHNKLFDILSQKSDYKKNPNLFVMPFLLILYVLPAVLTITFYSEPFYIKLSIVCYISLYTGIYLKFSKL
jgi:UDP-N-acetylmuramyl pentapeptide phosphotransferase/UDP-N-acetylglucosamine-1-phosphate transferase